MSHFFAKPIALFVLVACVAVVTVISAASPSGTLKSRKSGNDYYLYTKDLQVKDSGVVPVPARYAWSVETNTSGFDLQGNRISDGRLMLRLYDPEHNFTAFTAQMDIATATKLHSALGDILVKKLRNPNFQHNPRLYDEKDIPKKRIVGIDADATAILEDIEDCP